MTLRRWSFAVLAATVVPLLAASARSHPDHLFLEAEAPKADTVLSSSPPSIMLLFSQEPLPNTTTVHLRDAEGSLHPVSEAIQVAPEDPFLFKADVKETLSPGEYTVFWHTMSDDEPGGLTRDGSWKFTVATP